MQFEVLIFEKRFHNKWTKGMALLATSELRDA